MSSMPFSLLFRSLPRFLHQTLNTRFASIFGSSVERPHATHWVLMIGAPDYMIGRQIGDQLVNTANRHKTPMNRPEVVKVASTRVCDWVHEAHRSAEFHPDFVLCVVPDGDKEIYTKCKEVFCGLGITSQMMSGSKADSMKGNARDMSAYCGSVLVQSMDKMAFRRYSVSLNYLPKVSL